MEAAHIRRELAPHFFPVDCFGGSSDLVGTGSTLFSGGLFLEAAQFEVQSSGRLCFSVGSNYNRKKSRPEKKIDPKTIGQKIM